MFLGSDGVGESGREQTMKIPLCDAEGKEECPKDFELDIITRKGV